MKVRLAAGSAFRTGDENHPEVQELIHYGFEDLGLKRIWYAFFDGNENQSAWRRNADSDIITRMKTWNGNY